MSTQRKVGLAGLVKGLIEIYWKVGFPIVGFQVNLAYLCIHCYSLSIYLVYAHSSLVDYCGEVYSTPFLPFKKSFVCIM